MPSRPPRFSRDTEISFLRDTISNQGLHNSPILFYGLPFIGKTTLRRQIITDVLEQELWPFIDIDVETQTARGNISPEYILVHIAALLSERYNLRFLLFRYAASYIREDLPKHSVLPFARSQPATDTTDLLDKLVQAIEHIPALGVLSKLYKLVDHLGAWLGSWIKRREISLLRSRLRDADRRQLTQIFLETFAKDIEEEINKVRHFAKNTGRDRIIIILDHLDHMKSCDTEFVLKLSDLSKYIQFIVFSSDREIFHNHEGNYEVITKEVKKFEFETCRRLLESVDIRQPDIQRHIFDLSLEGHPQFLCLAIDICRVMVEHGIEPTVDALTNLSPGRQMVSRLFSPLTRAWRPWFEHPPLT